MRDAIRDDTRVLWIATQQPTHFFAVADVEGSRKGAAAVLVVLDEAYGEFLPHAERCDTTAWLARFPNLLIVRTFSKRMVWPGCALVMGRRCCSHQFAEPRAHPFNVNAPALAAAEAALDDVDFLARSYALNSAAWRNWRRLERTGCGRRAVER